MFAGQLLFIPTGWIYANLQTMDSVFAGGHFLHSLDIPSQLASMSLTSFVTPLSRDDYVRLARCRGPTFERLHWVACSMFVAAVRDNKGPLTKWELQGIYALLEVLLHWLEGGRPHEAPTESLGDPAALISELEARLPRKRLRGIAIKTLRSLELRVSAMILRGLQNEGYKEVDLTAAMKI